MNPPPRLAALCRLLFVVSILSGLARPLPADGACQLPPQGISAWFPLESDGKDRLSETIGTVPQGALFGLGKVGDAVYLDGAEGIRLAPDARFDRTTFTLETWIKRSNLDVASKSFPGDGGIFSGQVGSYGLAVAADGQLFLSHIGIQSYWFGTKITDLNWHHLALVRTGDTFRLYLDGKAAGTLVQNIQFQAGGPFGIGTLPNPFNGYHYAFWGAIDEFSFYSEALSAEEILALYSAGSAGKCSDTPPPGVNCIVPPDAVAWYPLDTDSRDFLSLSPPVPNPSVGYSAGMVEGAATFNGLNGGIAVPSAVLQSQDFTVETWVRRQSSSTASGTQPGDAAIFAGGVQSFSVTIRGFDGIVFLSHVGVTSFFSQVRIRDTEWHHLAVTKSGNEIRFYLDGQLGSTVTTAGQVFNLASDYAIGSLPTPYQGNWYAFLGSIDELTVYNRPLSPAEILRIALLGSDGKCRSPIRLSIAAPQEVIIGESFTAGIRVQNLSSETLPVAVTSLFPDSLVVKSASVSSGTISTRTTNQATAIDLTLPSLAPGSESLLTVELVGQAHSIQNLISSGTAGDTNPPVTAKSTVLVRPVCLQPPAGIGAWWTAESNVVELISGRPALTSNGVSFVSGKIGTAFRINGGVGSGLSLGNLPALQRAEFSVEGWIRRDSISATSLSGFEGTILGADTGGWYVSVQANGALSLGRNGGGSVQSGAVLTDTQWHHVAVTRSAVEVRFHVDGELVAARDFTQLFALDLPYGLGGLFPSQRNAFLGDLDEISFYPRVLAASEIRTLATSGSAPKCYQDLTITSTAGGPVAAGEDFTARFLVGGIGNDSTGVSFRYSLPAGMQFISATASQGSVENLAGLIQGQLGTIPAGSNAVVTVVFRPLVPGVFNLLATVARNEPELTVENNRFESTLDVRQLTVSLVENIAVTEQSGQPTAAVFEIALNAVSPRTVAVEYETVGGTATPDLDFVPVRGRVEFAPGVVSQHVSVTVAGDGVYESPESFQLVLRNPGNAALGTFAATAVIQSPDPIPAVTVLPVIASEGQAGATPFRFDVTLDRPSGLPASVNFATLNDSARAPTDFTAAAGTVQFAPGETRKAVEVVVNGDSSIEPNELFYLVLSQANGLRLPPGGTPRTSGTILNDDAVPGQISAFRWDNLPASLAVSEPFTARLSALDATGTLVPEFNSVVEVKAFAGPGLPSPVVFTEIITQAPGAVELQNVGTNVVDLSGWAVHFYDLERWPAPKATFVFPVGTTMAAGDLVVIDATVLAGGSYPRFRLGQSVAWWDRGTAANPKSIRIGAVLADSNDAIIDSFFADDAVPSEIAIPTPITTEDWSGPAVAPAIAPATGFLRVPKLLRNSRQASDWILGQSGNLNLGLKNSGLLVPFVDAVPLALDPSIANGFAGGQWTGSLTVSGFAPEIRLVADDGNGHRGVSAPVPMTLKEDLEIFLSTDQPVITAGNLWVQYEVIVRNLGAKSASNVSAVLLLPSLFGSPTDDGPAKVSQGTASLNIVTWEPGLFGTQVIASFGDLAGGTQATLTYYAGSRASFAGPAYPTNLVVRAATLRWSPPDLNPDNDVASIQQEVSTSCAPISDGAAWWQADSTTASLFNALPAVEEGTMKYGPGRVGAGSFLFDGKNALRISHHPAVDFGPGEPFTIDLWFRANRSVQPFLTLLSKERVNGETTTGYRLQLNQGQIELMLGQSGGSTAKRLYDSADLRDGAWHHLYVGRDFSATLDGRVLSNGEGLAPGDFSNDAPLLIGRSPRGDVDDHWDGALDEIVIRAGQPNTLVGVAAARAGAHGHCVNELYYQPVQPRFLSSGTPVWTAEDAGVMGDPYRFEADLVNRGPGAALVRVNAMPQDSFESFQFRVGTLVTLWNPDSGLATSELVTIPAGESVRLGFAFVSTNALNRFGSFPTTTGLATRFESGQFNIPLRADTDGDGIPDDVELQTGHNPESASDAQQDLDGDGWTSAQEYEAGTLANDQNSALAVRIDDGNAVVSVVASRRYRFERSSSLAGGSWTLIQDFQPEADGTVVIGPVSGGDEAVYYRVKVSLPY